jgi:hypothetical protein
VLLSHAVLLFVSAADDAWLCDALLSLLNGELLRVLLLWMEPLPTFGKEKNKSIK